MHVMITGAAGMLGQKLVVQLAADESALGNDVDRLTLTDIAEVPVPQKMRDFTHVVSGDFSAKEIAGGLIQSRPDLIFHLASIVSGEAEADFEKGYRINLDGSRQLFESIRLESLSSPYHPKVIFASSIAVFGAPFPGQIPEEFFTTPLTSYGTQKAICELLLSDYSRRGIFDGVGLRLPTICIRPGLPNKAASGFFSNILREPLAGKEAVLPVDESVRHWFASPRAATGFMFHAAMLDTGAIGPRRNLTMPGLSATVTEEIEALRRFGGEKAVKLIKHVPDETIQRIVAGWPSNFDATRALSLGFMADRGFDDIIRGHLDADIG
ncbi:MAG: D-erythronate dehydrogenase [Rhizobiaceae bacterium]